MTENLPSIGVLFDHDVSQPLIARKERFVLGPAASSEMINLWRAAESKASQERERTERLEAQMRLASASKWLRLGKKLGLGPKLG